MHLLSERKPPVGKIVIGYTEVDAEGRYRFALVRYEKRLTWTGYKYGMNSVKNGLCMPEIIGWNFLPKPHQTTEG